MSIVTEALSSEGLEVSFKGRLLHPADDGYDECRRIWNAEIDRRPALIARCTGSADVVAAVRFARERGLTVSVRGGGHNVAGFAVADDVLMIDLQPMKGVHVDPARRLARAQAGVTLGEIDREVQVHGLAVPIGIATTTGLAGLTLGGGIGWLSRKYGLTVDNLVSAEVVTADGDVLTASADEHPDLFWGLRGGGGNFGIVTSFEFTCHPIGTDVLAGPVIYPLEDAPAVLRFVRDFVEDVPDELHVALNLRMAPDLPFVPRHLVGKPIVAVIPTWCGQPEEGERVLRPLRACGMPAADLVVVKPYLVHQSFFDATVPKGWHYYWKSHELPPLTDGVIDIVCEHAANITSPLTSFPIFHLGGAISRVGEDDTAYSQRGAAHNININAIWDQDPEPERHIEWVRRFWTDLQPHAVGVYVNFMGDEGPERIRQAYGATYERLVDLKGVYDPDNFFHHNQNIAP
jgi:FAD/FMN-containing dehydrogenase